MQCSISSWGWRGLRTRNVRGFLSGDGYHGIPLEKNAYELEGRFAADPKKVFVAAAEVRKWGF